MSNLWKGWRADVGGVSAVEFALILPLMLIMYLGTYQVVQAVSVYRKLTLTTRSVADLTCQYSTMSNTDISNVLGASAQIMTPFTAPGLVIVLTQIQVTAAGSGTVTWSKTLNGTAMTTGKVVTLPTNVATVGNSVILSQVSYSFTPVIGYQLTGPITMADRLYMVPRQTSSITYTSS